MDQDFKDILIKGVDAKIDELKKEYNEAKNISKQKRESVERFEKSFGYLEYLANKKVIEKELKNPNNDFVKLKRLEQQKKYIESNYFDINVSDVEKAKEYLKKKDVEANDLEDYEIIELANKERSNELVNKRLEDNCYLVDFDGKNCHGPCGGWSGSGRCECGNRRVDWVDLDEVYFLDDYGNFYAEAY